MKGISPLMATILIVASTIAIGGIISIWLTGLTQTQTTQVTAQAQDSVRCSQSVLFLTAKWTSTTSILSGTVSYDLGDIQIKDIKLSGGCGSNVNTNTSGTGMISLKQGEVNVVRLNLSTECGTTIPDFARVSGNCEGPVSKINYTVVTECKKGSGCGI